MTLSIRAATLATTAAAALAAAGPARGASPDVDAAVRLLRRAVTPQRDNSHLPLLVSLRQLRDPTLPALFTSLLDSPDWQVQVHAVLGLSDLDPSWPVDSKVMARLDRAAQDPIVAEMLDEGRWTPAAIRELLAWDGLGPVPRAILLAELVKAGEAVDVGSIRTLAEDDDPRAAALASCLLARLDAPAALDACRSRIATLDRRVREVMLEWLVEAIRQYELIESLPLVIEAVDQLPRRRGAQDLAVLTALQLDVRQGLQVWETCLADRPTYGRRVRLGLLLLAADEPVAPSAFSRLGVDDELLQAIADVGAAFAANADPVPPMIALLDQGTPRSTDWVMSHVRGLPPRQARRIYAHLLDSLTPDSRPADITLVVDATARLLEIDTPAVLDRLADAEDDGQVQQILLLGLFEATTPDVGRAAAAVPRSGPRRADSLALLLTAKHADSLSAEDLDQLALIAAGGGQVSDLLQVQAAWLLLRHADAVDDAVARIFSH